MAEKSTNTARRGTAGTEAQANQVVDASTVQDWKPGLQFSRMTGLAAANRSAKAHAVLPLVEGRPENHKPDYPAWHKPYAEALLETDPQTLVKLLAATERAVFERLLELAAAEVASDERQDIRRAIDVLLTLKAGKIQARLPQVPHDAKTGSSARGVNRVLHHNGKIEYRRFT